jgi:hypothetical protein
MQTEHEIQIDKLNKEMALLRYFNDGQSQGCSLQSQIEQLQKEIALLRQINHGLCWVICELKEKYADAAPQKHPQLPDFSQKEDAYIKTTA